MKNEEAIVFWEKLRKTFEENEKAEKNPFAKIYKTSIEAIDAALEALNQGAAWTSKAEPLTMEQLLEMDGQPVWIMEAPDWGHWELSEDAGDYLTDRDPELYGLTYPDPEGKGGLHKLGWIAYAYKPAHIDPEAWTAEWVENGECDHKPYRVRDAEKWKKYKCSKCGYKAGRRTSQRYCPCCGRAMTPEAWAMLEKRLRG